MPSVSFIKTLSYGKSIIVPRFLKFHEKIFPVLNFIRHYLLKVHINMPSVSNKKGRFFFHDTLRDFPFYVLKQIFYKKRTIFSGYKLHISNLLQTRMYYVSQGFLKLAV